MLRKGLINQESPENLKKLMRKHCIYLENESVEIEGIRIYGSPCSIHHGASAFAYKADEAKDVWDQIPEVDILITHSPPYGYLDIGKKQGVHCGCPVLREKVDKIKPKIHVFGHIHESFVTHQTKQTLFVNAAQCGTRRVYLNKPIEIKYPHKIKAKVKEYE